MNENNLGAKNRPGRLYTRVNTVRLSARALEKIKIWEKEKKGEKAFKVKTCLPDGRRPPLGMITLACCPVDNPPSCCCCCPGCFIEGLALLLCCCWCCCWLAWWKSLVSWVWKAPVDSEISALSWNGAKFTHNLHRPLLVPTTLTWNCPLFPKMMQLYCNSYDVTKICYFCEGSVKIRSGTLVHPLSPLIFKLRTFFLQFRKWEFPPNTTEDVWIPKSPSPYPSFGQLKL